MRIQVGEQIFHSVNFRKCVEAIAEADGQAHVACRYYSCEDELRWEVEIQGKHIQGWVYANCPWKALCELIRLQPKAAARSGIRLVAERKVMK